MIEGLLEKLDLKEQAEQDALDKEDFDAAIEINFEIRDIQADIIYQLLIKEEEINTLH